ncbi:hypothetical protein J3E69DRAFT_379747 [Trichoderma sp. SZMC 28015]
MSSSPPRPIVDENGVNWSLIPSELREMILKAIVRCKKPGWGSHAAVSKEWQSVIEVENFRRLKLRYECVFQLEHMVAPERQKLVRHIWLNIGLFDYNCGNCHIREDRYNRESNNIKIETALGRLFSVICHWPWQPEKGLKLELNAYSDSDSQHFFQHYYIGAEHEENPEEVRPNRVLGGQLPAHDPTHGWINDQRVFVPPTESIWRLFSAMFLTGFREAPRVAAVTSLVIRRQLRRCFSPFTLQVLLDKLPCLLEISYDRWISRSVKRIVIFEDTNDDITTAMNFYADPLWDSSALDSQIGKVFADRSLQLEQLAASFMTDARHFFHHCQKSWVWPRLQSLALTTSLLCSTSSREGAAALLRAAAKSALNMPKLHTMALWYGARREACAFIYKIRAGTASITSRSTWHMDLNHYPGVIRAWNNVGFKALHRDIHVSQDVIQEVIESHGDAIHYLRLPCTVIDPVSLWQIRKETARSRINAN